MGASGRAAVSKQEGSLWAELCACPREEQGEPSPAAQPCVLSALPQLGGTQPWGTTSVLQPGCCSIIFLLIFNFLLLVVHEHFSQMNLEGLGKLQDFAVPPHWQTFTVHSAKNLLC